MWWPSAPRRTALAALLALAACGFAPAYGPGGTGSALTGQVSVSTPETVLAYRMRNRLTDRLGAAAAPHWALAITPTSRQVASAETADGTQARGNLLGQSGWRLTEIATGALVAEGTVDAFTGYAATGSTVATRSAERDALDRLAVMLADLVVTRLLALPPP